MMTRSHPVTLQRHPIAVCLSLIAGLACASFLAGCNADMTAGVDLESATVPETTGQKILFVGADPSDLRRSFYLAEAVQELRSSTDETGPDLTEAESFNITDLGAGTEPYLSTEQGELMELFPSSSPFPVPDRTGSLVAAVAALPEEANSHGVGRVLIRNLITGQLIVTPDLHGIHSLHFSWFGGWLLVGHQDAEEPDRQLLSLIDHLDGGVIVPLLPDDDATFRFAGLERWSDRLLLLREDRSTLRRDIIRYEPGSGTSELLTESVEGQISSASLSPKGRWIALEITDEMTGTRQLAALDLDSPQADPQLLGAEGTDECFWGAWQPEVLPARGEEPEFVARLAAVCQSMDAGRPDIVLWTPGETDALQHLTQAPQPELFDGSMAGLTIRSQIRWAPNAQLLVFGASPTEDALESGSMSLVALSLSPGSTASPIFSAGESSSAWAHFSSAITRPHLIVWDRSETGLADSSGRHPILVVMADQPGSSPHGVQLGQNLYVSYPQYLGANTMLYP